MSCDVANAVNDTWYRLGFQNAADASNAQTWVTQAELFQFADDAVKRLARNSSVFLTYDISTGVTAGVASYPQPTGEVLTAGAWLLYTPPAVQLLRITTAAELWALDATWPATTGDPKRLSMDAQGATTKVLYPKPVRSATLALVIVQQPATVAAGASVLPVSPILQDFFTWSAIAGARSKESDSRMQEVSDHLNERLNLLEQVLSHLWGEGR
jgi:hypothetical protein